MSAHRSYPQPTRTHHSTSQADLDILSLLSGDSAHLGPLSAGRSGADASSGTADQGRKRQLPRRNGPLDALMISAVVSGSGSMSRHHFGHGAVKPSAYASCDESRPASPPRETAAVERAPLRSMQAPRSERLRRASALDAVAGPSTHTHQPTKDKTRRRMSIDPAPVSANLQASSPPNFIRPISASISTFTAQPSTRPQVRCMARTRVPTPHGDVFLHLYHNNVDNKEHLAIVLDPIQLSPEARAAAPRGRKEIRSRSLDEQWREGETDMERVVRGAYVGRLVPGGEGQASVPSHADGIPEEAEDSMEEDDVLPLVRIHSECFTGETIGSMRCDCGEQLDEAIRRIASPQQLASPGFTDFSSAADLKNGFPTPEPSRSPSPASQNGDSTSTRAVPGRGVVIYMRQEGRGIGLLEKIRAYNLQDLGHDTVTANLMLGHGADERKYDVAAEILRDLGLGGSGQGVRDINMDTEQKTPKSKNQSGIRLLTNNPDKVQGLAKEGIVVNERVGMVPRDWKCDGQDDEDAYGAWRDRRGGVGLIGAGKASGVELERYLRTKVERMGHLISLPDDSS